MLAALLLLAAGQWAPAGLDGPVYSVPSLMAQGLGPSLPFFSAFDVNGLGTTSACSTTPPTGAKGEPLIFARTGNATCSKKGLATTGLQPGDLVVMTTDQPRVEPNEDGVLFLRSEGPRTNAARQSQALDVGAVWVPGQTGAPGLPVVTANAATAPDGTLTAERIQVPVVTAAQDSFINQASVCATGAACMVSVYAKANGAACSLDLCSYTGGATTQCARTALVTTSWTRMAKAATAAGGAGGLTIGSLGIVASGGIGANAACDAFVWQAQAESGATYATSPIPTEGAAVTRNAESAYFTIAPGAHANYSMASTSSVNKAAGTNYAPLVLWEGATTYRANYGSGALNCDSTTGGSALIASRAAVGSFSNKRIVCFNDGNERGIYDGTVFATPSAAATRTVAPTRAYVGQSFAAGFEVDGLVGLICFEPGDPTRCR